MATVSTTIAATVSSTFILFQSLHSNALTNEAVGGLVRGGTQQVGHMAVQGLIGGTANPNGVGDGINILELLRDLFFN
ncbi:hypothetical protein ACH5RR_025222 [Cinchona calisaya]|uniref:Uncharacterized protein n=1 Tax=Cinchona calisaya TaxID=153742 RepID=A0ABD2Z2C9_9GENT